MPETTGVCDPIGACYTKKEHLKTTYFEGNFPMSHNFDLKAKKLSSQYTLPGIPSRCKSCTKNSLLLNIDNRPMMRR